VSQQQSAFIVVAQIAEAILPIARGTRYEDPLEAALKGAGLGRVNGGGSMLGTQRQVESVDIEIALRDLEGALEFARATLLSLGAPAGSLLLFLRDGRPRAVDIATREEFDHQPTLDALKRRLMVDGVDDDDDEEEERERVAGAAARTLSSFEGLWAGSYEYPPADLSTYSADWLRWYDQVAEALTAHGFGFAGDIATVRTDLPVPKTFGFSRKFLAADGITRVDAFQVATAKPKPPSRVLVFKSEFGDGRYLSTSNVVLKWNVPDFIDYELLPPEASADVIARHHAERLAACPAMRLSAVLRLSSLAELLAAEERERVRTRLFRQRQRVPTQIELERLGAPAEFAALVHAEMRRLKGM
jgi:hypothetical protein